jgi:hypothetical protein
MQRPIILLIFILISLSLFSQKRDTSNYRNGFAFNIESLAVEDFKLSYSRRINDDVYFEAMLSYNIPNTNHENRVNNSASGEVNGEDAWVKLYDPYYYYGRTQIRAGLKLYNGRRFYVCPELLYNYGSFKLENNILYQNGNHNDYFEVSRFKNDFEFLFKWGWTYQTHHLLRDLFMGFGFRFKYLNDQVYAESLNYGQSYFNVVPYNKKTTLTAFELHLGFQLGYCK